MNENLDLTKILKDCPKGTELYSPIYGLGILTKVTDRIHVKFPKEHNVKCFRPDGKVSEDGEIMLFPQGKKTWEGFQRPFKDGDILYIDYNDDEDTNKKFQYTFILKEISDGKIYCYCYIDGVNINKRFEICWLATMKTYTPRFATEEEKQKFFNTLKENGYEWNVETKTLEKLIKPKFKVGDKVRNKTNNRMTGTIIALYEEVYEVKNPLENEFSIDFINQDRFELVPKKFDPKTLKPFDKVLGKLIGLDTWHNDFYSHYDIDSKYPYMCTSRGYKEIIPYNDDTKHLIGTSDEAPEFYRYWEE